MFNYNIPFHIKERITIIHAPNGYGKTTILKAIDDIFSRNFSELKEVCFDEIYIQYTNKSSLKITKHEDRNKNKMSFLLKQPKHKDIEYDLITKVEIPEFLLDTLSQELPSFYRRIGPDKWIDTRRNKVMPIEYLIERYLSSHIRNDLYSHPSHPIQNKRIPIGLRKHLMSLPTRFIKSQRLYQFDQTGSDRNYIKKEREMTPSVIAYSDELRRAIERKLAESASYSQELDRTFPSRLIDKMAKIKEERAPSSNSIKSQLKELEITRSRLQNVGLYTGSHLPIKTKEKMDKHTLKVLSMYIEDNEQKLSIFNDMEKKINLMKNILNTRFSHKDITINSVDGFEITLIDGSKLSPENLSSGEQHELVLNYELLFKSKEGSLILMDEPEISLHISWQKHFLNDLQKIADLTNVDIIIATHSPQIINDKWHLTIDMEEGG